MNKILTMLFAVAGVFSSQATIYYASPDGTAEADCLSENTAGDIYTAISKAKASGDIIQLAEGTYQITTSPVTLSVDGIMLKGADEEDATKTVLLGPGTTKNMTGVVVTKKATISDLTIKNFYLTGKGGAAVAGANAAQTKADNLTAINCRVEANRSSSNNRYNRAAAVYGGTWNNCFFSATPIRSEMVGLLIPGLLTVASLQGMSRSIMAAPFIRELLLNAALKIIRLIQIQQAGVAALFTAGPRESVNLSAIKVIKAERAVAPVKRRQNFMIVFSGKIRRLK